MEMFDVIRNPVGQVKETFWIDFVGFRSESNTSCSEVRNFNWWMEIDVFTHIKSMSNEFQIHFQG